MLTPRHGLGGAAGRPVFALEGGPQPGGTFSRFSSSSTCRTDVALGGSSFAVVGGKGTVRVGGQVGIASDPEDIRTLPRIGAILAECDSGEVTLRFRNNSGEGLHVEGYANYGSAGESVHLFNVSSNNSPANVTSNAGLEDSNAQVHISPVDGSSRPQADVNVTVNETGNCSTTPVRVLALVSENS